MESCAVEGVEGGVDGMDGIEVEVRDKGQGEISVGRPRWKMGVRVELTRLVARQHLHIAYSTLDTRHSTLDTNGQRRGKTAFLPKLSFLSLVLVTWFRVFGRTAMPIRVPASP